MKENNKIFFFFISIFFFTTSITEDFAFITNQESNKVDVINLSTKEKVKEINVGQRPAAIYLDHTSNKVFVSNPESDNVSVIDFLKNSNTQIGSGPSPMGISVDGKKISYLLQIGMMIF